jgi:hypothetical protein
MPPARKAGQRKQAPVLSIYVSSFERASRRCHVNLTGGPPNRRSTTAISMPLDLFLRLFVQYVG